MRYYADLHIHSVLSPCADFLMTPDNIISRLKECGISIFSITDHNACGNSRIFMQKAEENGILFIPGIEIQTAEEIHVVAYFNDINVLEKVAEKIKETLPNIKNSEEIYGYQLIVDETDDYCAKEEAFLAGASSMGIDEVAELIRVNSGFFVPAHIDRSSSILSNLGYIPNLEYDGFEIYGKKNISNYITKYSLNKAVLCSSDAHVLESIEKKGMYIECDKLNIELFFNELKNNRIFIEGVERWEL